MYESIGSAMLHNRGAIVPNPDTMQILKIESQNTVWALPVLKFLSHKPPHYIEHLEKVFYEPERSKSKVSFFLGVLKTEIISCAMLLEQNGVGHIAHVFTQSQYRRRGAGRSILWWLIDDFERREGNLLLLNTDPTGAAADMYLKFNFVQQHRGSPLFYRWSSLNSKERYLNGDLFFELVSKDGISNG